MNEGINKKIRISEDYSNVSFFKKTVLVLFISSLCKIKSIKQSGLSFSLMRNKEKKKKNLMISLYIQ